MVVRNKARWPVYILLIILTGIGCRFYFKTGRELSPPMDKFKSLTDKQVNAIYSYLRSVKPVPHLVK
ncbi:hypothetical protein A3860_08995 [Niastella vici]|uniref:Cytochrome c domain-containing protein n=1 Tax=Niastella vici TaxID=1703345 RepID=A0A1V9FHB4_9BACT|nr:hypothetical protein [Niastella vici]OQP57753.1 hypothetical protein A3860_08995 [Niastella vici]